jgi:predicted kinase
MINQRRPTRSLGGPNRPTRQVLVVVGGLPATGKSTIATVLAKRTKTPYLRVDRIEHAIVSWSALSHPLGPVGYAVAHELALEQLRLGLDVIVECVNPLALRLSKSRSSARMRLSTGAASRLEPPMSKSL